jgi:hypothetical protein
MRFIGKKKISFICANSSYSVTAAETVSAGNVLKNWLPKSGPRISESPLTCFVTTKPASPSGERLDLATIP